jgi:hypothetical protein
MLLRVSNVGKAQTCVATLAALLVANQATFNMIDDELDTMKFTQGALHRKQASNLLFSPPECSVSKGTCPRMPGDGEVGYRKPEFGPKLKPGAKAVLWLLLPSYARCFLIHRRPICAGSQCDQCPSSGLPPLATLCIGLKL